MESFMVIYYAFFCLIALIFLGLGVYNLVGFFTSDSQNTLGTLAARDRTREESQKTQTHLFVKAQRIAVLGVLEKFAKGQKLEFWATEARPLESNLVLSQKAYDQGPGYLEIKTHYGEMKRPIQSLSFYLDPREIGLQLHHEILKGHGLLEIEIEHVIGHVECEIKQTVLDSNTLILIKLAWRDRKKRADHEIFVEFLATGREPEREKEQLIEYQSRVEKRNELNTNKLAQTMLKWNLELERDIPRFSIRPTWRQFQTYASKQATIEISQQLYDMGILLDLDNHKNRGRPINLPLAYRFLDGQLRLGQAANDLMNEHEKSDILAKAE